MNFRCLLIISIFLFSFQCGASNIQGTVQLSGAIDHGGVNVIFIPKSQSALAASTFTLSDGSYSLAVVAGVYDIKYSKTGYQEVLFVDQFISSDLILNQVILSSKPVIQISGDVQGNWLNTNTYMINGNTTIPLGAELVIQEGTTVQFSGFYQLEVKGKLTAIGTEDNRIIFTTSKSTKARGDWAGIFVRTTSDTTRFVYCQIEYAASKNAETAIINNYGNAKISNSIIRGSAHTGISNGSFNFNFSAFAKIENSEISDCYWYGIVSYRMAKDAIIRGNKVHHVDLIGISCEGASLVAENRIYNNGVYGINSFSGAVIKNNLVFNNGYGVYVVDGKPSIESNTIYKNYQGIGLYDPGSGTRKPSAIIKSNIIFQNTNYGIYCDGTFIPEIVAYNLIYGNPSGVTNRGPVGIGVKVTTNIYGYQADTYLNIFENPGFFSVDNQDKNFLYLLPTSRAIDAGEPQYKDPDNSTLDCGAIPFQKYNQVISFADLISKTFGDTDFTLTASSTSSLAVKFSSDNASVAVVEGNLVKIVGAGKANIIATQAGNENYKPAPEKSRLLTVIKSDQAITFNNLPAKTFGDVPFTLAATSSSGLPIVYTSSNTSVATISGNTVTIIAAGATTITASNSGNTNYNAAGDVAQQLTVNKKNQTITFVALASKTFGDATFTLSATADSGLPITYVSSNALVATVLGNSVTIVSSGVTTITASNSGSTNYNAAVDAVQQLTVNKKNQAITFAALTSKTFGDPAFTLSATSDSGLPIAYTSSNTSIAAILSGNSVSISGAGFVTITAIQSGNENYNPSANISQGFCVNPAKPIVTTDLRNPSAPILTSSATSGNQWYSSGASISDATLATYTVSTPGLYTVKVAAGMCVSVPSNEVVIVVTDIAFSKSEVLKVYPNPADKVIEINFSGQGIKYIEIFNSEGKIIDKLESARDNERLIVEDYPSGLYLIKAQSLTGTEIERFVKR